MPYDWEGTRILQKYTAIEGKRRIYGRSTYVRTDLREWITAEDREEVRTAIRDMTSLPVSRDPGEFDRRARVVWEWVAEKVTYTDDEKTLGVTDFWQFPAETLALGHGDCEDCAALLTTLLVASGISPFCVRCVFGRITSPTLGNIPHVWPVYKDESGSWRILEATLDPVDLPESMPSAEGLTRRSPHYVPVLCFNQSHVWEVGRREQVEDPASFVVEEMEKTRAMSRGSLKEELAAAITRAGRAGSKS